MEESLTPAERVRRKLKSGRKPGEVAITPLEALHRAVERSMHARALMVEEGLNPDDIRVALVWIVPEEVAGAKLIPASGIVGNLLVEFERRAATHTLLFLGLFWEQTDRTAEQRGEEPFNSWVAQWTGGEAAEATFRALRDKARAAHGL
jgi:hypothetical protein